MSENVRAADALAILAERDLEVVVVIGVARDGTLSLATHGTTPRKRVAIDGWCGWLWRNALRPDPFSTVFGVGYGGKPTTAEEEV